MAKKGEAGMRRMTEYKRIIGEFNVMSRALSPAF
jgi:hypothetical protein